MDPEMNTSAGIPSEGQNDVPAEAAAPAEEANTSEPAGEEVANATDTPAEDANS